MPDITLVVMTRDRVADVLATLGRLTTLPERVPVVVVDNGSTDGTVEEIRRRFPQVEVLPLRRNLGVEARNIAVRRAATAYIAFNDDDSWWEPGTLSRVAETFDAHPRLGAVVAHVVVEPGGRDDPTSLEMRDSPLDGDAGVPGIPVLGFLACSAAVRRSAFLQVGGFQRRFHFSGEEQLLAADLATRGWEVRYVPELVIHHQAAQGRNRRWRQRRDVRNDLWFLWLRRPLRAALRGSAERLKTVPPGVAIAGLAQAVAGGWWVLPERAVVPPEVEEQLRRLDAPSFRAQQPTG